MCKGVLKGVFDLRKKTRLIKKLRGLEPCEAETNVFLRLICDLLEQRERDVLSNNSS
jgi:hypothetical protein